MKRLYLQRLLIFGAIFFSTMLVFSEIAFTAERVQIVYSTWGAVGEEKIEQAAVDLLEKEYPNIEVKIVLIPTNYEDKVLTMIAGGQTPDVILTGNNNLADFADRGLYEDLMPYVKRDKIDLSKYPKPMIDMGTYRGKLYSFAKDYVVWGLFYNQDLFDKAGISYPDKGWTWDTFLNAAKKLTIERGGKKVQFGCTFDTWWGYTTTYIWQNGGNVWNDDFSASLVDQPAAYEAIQWWADLMNKYNVAPTAAQATEQQQAGVDMFQTGLVGMYLTGRYMVPLFRESLKFKWDTSYLPMGKVRANMMTAGMYALSAKSKHKEEAWTYIKFMSTSEQAQIVRSKTGLAMPPLLSLLETDVFLTPGLPPSRARIFIEELEWTKPFPSFPHNLEFLDNLARILDPVWLGTKSAEDALTKGKATLDEILAKGQRQ